ncbi:MAG TPA: type II toxin-antitoxin system prevent-host-death family antitoxin [Geminicoccaceae bacterium]|mgnify:FL=1|nr:type II toxin-antitoxin system prevent-host-death family antitoxin [Geminicoccus sp.]HMU51041.1 type II toxin-antitoxin system prevent-host-death family antitoxin [Geminicoccaceae bacterium]
MLTLSSREANQNFSRVIRAAANGEEVVITRRGVPVAKVVPMTTEDKAAAERQAAIERTRERLKKGFSLGGNAWPGRDVLYDDALGIAPWPE